MRNLLYALLLVLLRQPAFQDVDISIVGDLHNTNEQHERGFWVGVWPGTNVI